MAERALDGAPWRVPAGLIVALVVLLAFEGAIRTLPADRLAFGGVGGRGDVSRGYFAYLLDEPPVPDVAFIGSSRVRDDIVCSVVEHVGEEKLGHPIRVQNYGWPTATNADLDMFAEAILRAGHPSLIVAGIEPRTFVTRRGEAYRSRIARTPERWRTLLDNGLGNARLWPLPGSP